MEIKEFLGLCIDKWLALRTTYQLFDNQIDNSKSDLIIENVGLDSPELVKICQKHRIKLNSTLSGLKTSWDTSQDYGKPKQTGSTIVVWIPDPENSQTGKILQQGKSLDSLLGYYSLGQDQALTLTLEGDNLFLEERIWFASPNLRLRTSLMKQANGFTQTAFYSEIRRVTPKEP
jgi:hypothetical protein